LFATIIAEESARFLLSA